MNQNLTEIAGAHLGFLESKVQTLEKGQTNIKQKRNEHKPYIGDNFLN